MHSSQNEANCIRERLVLVGENKSSVITMEIHGHFLDQLQASSSLEDRDLFVSIIN